jgi:LCP family protein required for cell wall assembly
MLQFKNGAKNDKVWYNEIMKNVTDEPQVDIREVLAMNKKHRLIRRGFHSLFNEKRYLRNKIIALVLTFSLTAVASYGGLQFLQLVGAMNIVQESYIAEEERPPADPNAGSAVNILMIGVDSRDGEENQFLGGAADDVLGIHNSDTTILMHISSDRSRIEGISIPRDSMVNIPQCKVKGGNVAESQRHAMFNSAFANAWNESGDNVSAAQCVQKTVETLTGVRVDYLVIADFSGFKNMVTALDGVDICVNEPITTIGAGGLTLPAGRSHLNGEAATQFARARHGTGLDDESDLKRIERQQKLVGAIIKGVKDKNLLDISKLWGFVSAATRSLTTTMTVEDMVGLATSLKDIHLSNVYFVMTPVVDDPTDANRVLWDDSADDIWEKLIRDKPILGVATPPSSADETTPNSDDQPTAETPSPEPSSVGQDSSTGLSYRTAFGADTCEPKQ